MQPRLGRSSSRPNLGGKLLLLWITLVSATPALTLANPDPGSRSQQTQAIFNTLQTGDWHRALSLLENFNRQFPHDPKMLYNQACLENRAGQRDQAFGTLRLALSAGFDEMGFALQDPDLKGLANDPQLFQLAPAARRELLQTSRERQISLQYRQWSDPVVLAPADPLTSRPQVRLNWLQVGLRVEITTEAPWDDFTHANLPPWAGGPGAILNLVIPDSTVAFSGGNTFSFAFGAEKGGPTAAQFLSGPSRWQRVAEMDPKLSQNQAGQAVLTATIPWPSIIPFHPLVDPVLGFNLQIRRDSAHGYTKATLLPDPWAWAPTAAIHRYVPFVFQLETVDTDLFMGRLPDSISGQVPLKMELIAVCPQGGQARLSFNFIDPAIHSVLPGGTHSETVELQPGLNTLIREADFRGLKSGAYLIRTGLRFPSGENATWSTTVLQMATGWQEDLEHRIGKLPTSEQPTLRRMLDAIATAIPAHKTRRITRPIATTLQDMQAMLNQATATGSILPNLGPVTLVYPGDSGEQRLCTLYLTAANDSTRSLAPVLLIPPVSGQEGFLIDRIARNHEYGAALADSESTRRLVYILPHDMWTGVSEAQAEKEALACLRWTLDFLHARQAAVVGIGAGGGPALRLCSQQPNLVTRLLVFTAKDLTPWPKLDAAGLATMLTPPPPIPVTWVDFPLETDHRGQGPAILAQLRQTGWTIADTSAVRGGLSLSQAADRLVLWATGLKKSGPE